MNVGNRLRNVSEGEHPDPRLRSHTDADGCSFTARGRFSRTTMAAVSVRRSDEMPRGAKATEAPES